MAAEGLGELMLSRVRVFVVGQGRRLGHFLTPCIRLLAPIVDVTAVRLSVLLAVLLDELGRGDAHLAGQRYAVPRARTLIVSLGVSVEVLEHQGRLMQLCQLVFVVRLRSQALETNVVVVFSFWDVSHLQIFLGNRQWVVSAADRQVEVALRASDAGQHHRGGLEVNRMQHSLLTLRPLIRLLQQELADIRGGIC